MVDEIDLDVLGAIHYVMVCQDVSICANDHTRSQRVFDLARRRLPAAGEAVAEELPEQRILCEWKLFRSTRPALSANSHHRRRSAIHYVRVGQRGTRLADDCGRFDFLAICRMLGCRALPGARDQREKHDGRNDPGFSRRHTLEMSPTTRRSNNLGAARKK